MDVGAEKRPCRGCGPLSSHANLPRHLPRAAPDAAERLKRPCLTASSHATLLARRSPKLNTPVSSLHRRPRSSAPVPDLELRCSDCSSSRHSIRCWKKGRRQNLGQARNNVTPLLSPPCLLSSFCRPSDNRFDPPSLSPRYLLTQPTMAAVDLSADALTGFGFDSRGLRYPYTSRVSWPIPIEQHPSRAPPQPAQAMKRSTSPLQDHSRNHGYEQTSHSQPNSLLLNPEWQIPEQPHLTYPLENTYPPQYSDAAYTVSYQTSPTSFMPPQPHINHGLNLEGPYLPVGSHMDGMAFEWQDLTDLVTYPTASGLHEMNLAPQSLPGSSPTDTYLEVRSLTSNGSDNGWATVDYSQQSIFNPGQTLVHNRTFSDSSYSDLEQQPRDSWSNGYVEVPNAISSPGTDSLGDMDFQYSQYHSHDHSQHEDEGQGCPRRPTVVTSSVTKPINIKKSSSPQRLSPSAAKSSPPTRRQSRKAPSTKPMKAVARRPSQSPKINSEKRIGRRKGPLRPEQRQQAGEIRKLGACLRCKFLKKTVSMASLRSFGLAN